MSFTSQRTILVALADKGPLSVKALAPIVKLDERNVANLCSTMSGSGILNEHPNERGGRHGRRYGAGVEFHPTDARIVADLVSAYGAQLVRKIVREADMS